MSLASIAHAAIRAPSSTSWGIFSRKYRSLNVPGSPSSALTANKRGLGSFRTKAHFWADGNPAPPIPFNPEFNIVFSISL